MKANFQVTYFLWKARKDKDGNAPIYIRSKQNSDKQIAFNTGIKIHPQQWSKDKKRPKVMPGQLIDLEHKLQSTYTDLRNQGFEPNLTLLVEHLNDKKKPHDKNIVAWCKDYVNSPYSEGQKKSVRTLQSNIEDFHKGLTFDKLTKPRLKSFFDHLTVKGVANNSQYKRLRALINVANHANIEIPHLISYELPYTTANALKTRLTWPEVKAIMNAEGETKLEKIAKDVFLLACFSGLRISDLLTLQKGELNDFHYERLQTKTKLPVFVTVHKYNVELFKTYSNGISYSRQQLSKALKQVLERAGLTKEVRKVQAVGNHHKEIIQPKFKEISFHSGRRFYARLLNDLGLGGEIARDELGHHFKTVTDLYAGSPEHAYRVTRVRNAMETLEKSMKELASLMMVA